MFQQFFRNRFGQKRVESASNLNSGRAQRSDADQIHGGRGFRRGARGGVGRGGGNKPGSGPGGNCICPECGKQVPHVAGRRCFDQVCPDCGAKMVRE
jgi:hypothetical protein